MAIGSAVRRLSSTKDTFRNPIIMSMTQTIKQTLICSWFMSIRFARSKIILKFFEYKIMQTTKEKIRDAHY